MIHVIIIKDGTISCQKRLGAVESVESVYGDTAVIYRVSCYSELYMCKYYGPVKHLSVYAY